MLTYVCMCVHAQSLSPIQPLANPWAVAGQAPLSMGLSRQEYWSALPFPSLLPDPGIKPICLTSHALAGRFLYHLHLGNPPEYILSIINLLALIPGPCGFPVNYLSHLDLCLFD